MQKEITDRDSKEFKLAAYEVFQKIENINTSIEAAQKNLKDAAKSFRDYKMESLKKIAELRGQIASGAIQPELLK